MAAAGPDEVRKRDTRSADSIAGGGDVDSVPLVQLEIVTGNHISSAGGDKDSIALTGGYQVGKAIVNAGPDKIPRSAVGVPHAVAAISERLSRCSVCPNEVEPYNVTDGVRPGDVDAERVSRNNVYRLLRAYRVPRCVLDEHSPSG